MYVIVRQFAEAKPPLTEEDISERLDIPLSLTRIILHELSGSKLISTVLGELPAYQPAHDIQHLSVKQVIDALDQHGNDDIPISRSRISETLSHIPDEFGKAVEACPANMLIRDIRD
jgi:DNA-binding IscR family transcriptional regulator